MVKFANKASSQFNLFTDQLKTRSSEEDPESLVVKNESQFWQLQTNFLEQPERYTYKEIMDKINQPKESANIVEIMHQILELQRQDPTIE